MSHPTAGTDIDDPRPYATSIDARAIAVSPGLAAMPGFTSSPAARVRIGLTIPRPDIEALQVQYAEVVSMKRQGHGKGGRKGFGISCKCGCKGKWTSMKKAAADLRIGRETLRKPLMTEGKFSIDGHRLVLTSAPRPRPGETV